MRCLGRFCRHGFKADRSVSRAAPSDHPPTAQQRPPTPKPHVRGHKRIYPDQVRAFFIRLNHLLLPARSTLINPQENTALPPDPEAGRGGFREKPYGAPARPAVAPGRPLEDLPSVRGCGAPEARPTRPGRARALWSRGVVR